LNIRAAIYYFRLSPFSLETEEGRAAERYRLALLAILANLVSRLFAMLVMVLSVSWTVPYLGVERFGIWMTVSSFAVILSFLDLGIGNALTNLTAQAANANGGKALQRVITGGLMSLALISVAFVLPWRLLIKVQNPQLIEEVRDTAIVFSSLFSISIFFNGVTRILHGLQRGFEVHLADILGSLIGLLALSVAVNKQAGPPVLLLCFMGGRVLGNLSLFAALWFRGLFRLNGCVNDCRAVFSQLIRTGGLFFILQIGTIVGWGADSLIIASTSGAASVAAFSVIQRVIQFISQPLVIVNTPLWAAYADADTRNDRAFIKKTFLKSIKLTFGFSFLGAFLLVLIGRETIELWTKGVISVSLSLLGAMALWMILESTGNALGILLNGLGIVRQQVLVVTVLVVIALPLKLWLAQLAGPLGVVVGGILAYTFVTVAAYGFIFRHEIVGRIN
jgi:O-antigen/teichoic acid export membrane protein